MMLYCGSTQNQVKIIGNSKMYLINLFVLLIALITCAHGVPTILGIKKTTGALALAVL